MERLDIIRNNIEMKKIWEQCYPHGDGKHPGFIVWILEKIHWFFIKLLQRQQDRVFNKNLEKSGLYDRYYELRESIDGLEFEEWHIEPTEQEKEILRKEGVSNAR